MELDDRFAQLIELTRGRYETNGDPGHDFAHIMRVIENCKRIGEIVGAKAEILLPAALLHDIVNVPKDHPDRVNASQQAANEAAGLLKHVGYSTDEIGKIQVVITEHSYSLGRDPSNIESAVLQDADRLDALGAIGLMRMVTCGARLGSVYYDLNDPFARDRELNDKQFTIDHLYVKLFKLADQMNTHPAKEEANRRIEFMKDFVACLEHEINGK